MHDGLFLGRLAAEQRVGLVAGERRVAMAQREMHRHERRRRIDDQPEAERRQFGAADLPGRQPAGAGHVHQGWRQALADGADVLQPAPADIKHVGAGPLIGLGAAQCLVESGAAQGVGAADDHEIGVAARRHRGADLGLHQLGRDHVLDPDMMVGAFRQQLILDLDRGKPGRFAGHDRAADMHRVAPAAGAVENQRQRADGADVERGLGHLGQRQVGLGAGLDVAHRAAAEIERAEPRSLRQ